MSRIWYATCIWVATSIFELAYLWTDILSVSYVTKPRLTIYHLNLTTIVGMWQIWEPCLQGFEFLNGKMQQNNYSKQEKRLFTFCVLNNNSKSFVAGATIGQVFFFQWICIQVFASQGPVSSHEWQFNFIKCLLL